MQDSTNPSDITVIPPEKIPTCKDCKYCMAYLPYMSEACCMMLDTGHTFCCVDKDFYCKLFEQADSIQRKIRNNG